MSQYDLYRQEIKNDSTLSNWFNITQEVVKNREYSFAELTESKVLDIITELMHEKAKIDQLRGYVHNKTYTDKDFVFWAKITLCLLVEEANICPNINSIKEQLKAKINCLNS